MQADSDVTVIPDKSDDKHVIVLSDDDYEDETAIKNKAKRDKMHEEEIKAKTEFFEQNKDKLKILFIAEDENIDEDLALVAKQKLTAVGDQLQILNILEQGLLQERGFKTSYFMERSALTKELKGVNDTIQSFTNLNFSASSSKRVLFQYLVQIHEKLLKYLTLFSPNIINTIQGIQILKLTKKPRVRKEISDEQAEERKAERKRLAAEKRLANPDARVRVKQTPEEAALKKTERAAAKRLANGGGEAKKRAKKTEKIFSELDLKNKEYTEYTQNVMDENDRQFMIRVTYDEIYCNQHPTGKYDHIDIGISKLDEKKCNATIVFSVKDNTLELRLWDRNESYKWVCKAGRVEIENEKDIDYEGDQNYDIFESEMTSKNFMADFGTKLLEIEQKGETMFMARLRFAPSTGVIELYRKSFFEKGTALAISFFAIPCSYIWPMDVKTAEKWVESKIDQYTKWKCESSDKTLKKKFGRLSILRVLKLLNEAQKKLSGKTMSSLKDHSQKNIDKTYSALNNKKVDIKQAKDVNAPLISNWKLPLHPNGDVKIFRADTLNRWLNPPTSEGELDTYDSDSHAPSKGSASSSSSSSGSASSKSRSASPQPRSASSQPSSALPQRRSASPQRRSGSHPGSAARSHHSSGSQSGSAALLADSSGLVARSRSAARSHHSSSSQSGSADLLADLATISGSPHSSLPSSGLLHRSLPSSGSIDLLANPAARSGHRSPPRSDSAASLRKRVDAGSVWTAPKKIDLTKSEEIDLTLKRNSKDPSRKSRWETPSSNVLQAPDDHSSALSTGPKRSRWGPKDPHPTEQIAPSELRRDVVWPQHVPEAYRSGESYEAKRARLPPDSHGGNYRSSVPSSYGAGWSHDSQARWNSGSVGLYDDRRILDRNSISERERRDDRFRFLERDG